MIRLEPLTWDRLPDVVAIERELFHLQPWSEAQFWSELAGVPESRYYVVALDAAGSVVGYAGVYCNDPEAEIQTVAVAPTAQRQGIGVGRPGVSGQVTGVSPLGSGSRGRVGR